MSSHTHCRICGTHLPAPFLDLGAMPLANSFLKSTAEFPGEARYPLAVAACPGCGLVQLNYVVPAEQLYRDYIYVSSTSDGVRAHAEDLASSLIHQYGWTRDDLIVEVASNDGTVLKAFQKKNVRVLGIEPARNIALIAERDGVPTVPEFFDPGTAQTIRASHGPAKAIVGRHVFAHVNDVHGFFEGVDSCLAQDGVFVIEVPYLGDFLEKREFDTIYHEHLSYVSLAPMDRLTAAHGFELVDVQRASLHGGSIILHMRRQGVGRQSERLRDLLEAEKQRPLHAASNLAAFANGVTAWTAEFEALVQSLRDAGAKLIGYGAAAKANTLLNYCPDVAAALGFILDRSPHKHGRFTPGTHVRVEPVERWQTSDATHMLILAWNFQDEIMRQMKAFSDRGGRFVTPIPKPSVV